MSEESLDSANVAPGKPAPLYSERLWVPLWWWPIALGLAGLLAAEIHMGVSGIRAWLPYLVIMPLPVWFLVWLSRLTVTVTPGADGGSELGVGRAHLPASVVSRAAPVPASAKSAALGRQLDPAAFVQHRPWVKQMALLVLDDADDPTPYWLISTRKPAQLLAALGLHAATEQRPD